VTSKRHHPLNVAGEPRAFFGRRSGKRLHRGQDALYREVLPQLEIRLGGAPLDLPALFPDATRFALEIGFGGGEHLARQAAQRRDTGFIGCEVFSGGIAKLLQAIDDQELRNVRLFTDDALKLLLQLPDGSLDEAFLLYPDPWPKLRHHKRRFVSPTTLGELSRVLRPGAFFNFATDIEDYADWTLAHVLREPRLDFVPGAPGSWHQPFPGWEATRYEQKARLAGRNRSFYLRFRRR
jgi:tRNA (guanine-N7-)-methyltransferase